MKILTVVPAEYGYRDWVYRVFNAGIYRLASWLKKQGHDVETFAIRPEMTECACEVCPHVEKCHQAKTEVALKFGKGVPKWNCLNILSLHDGGIYYKGELLTNHIGNRSCGNWEKEKISRPLFRIGRPIERYVEKLLEFKPDQVMITCTFTYMWEGVKEAIDITRKVLPNTKISIGGVYPALVPDHATLLGADEIVPRMPSQEKDFIWTDLSTFEDIPCVIDVLTSMGCPNSCGYCAVSIIEGQKRIRRDPIDVVDELEYYSNNGIKFIRILDSNLICDYDIHFKKILEEIVRRNLKLSLSSYGGVEAKFITSETLDLMKKAGFTGMNVPLESASTKLLSRWNRKLDPGDWKEIATRVKRADMHIRSFVMIGCLSQTTSDVMDTIKFVEDIGIVPIALPFTPIPRTPEFFRSLQHLKDGWTLEELHPLLFPLANDEMKAEDLDRIFNKYSNHQARGCVARHPVDAPYQQYGSMNRRTFTFSKEEGWEETLI
jgi:hypothetical protein